MYVQGLYKVKLCQSPGYKDKYLFPNWAVVLVVAMLILPTRYP